MRTLDVFILDEMIEQYHRLNPLPHHSPNASKPQKMMIKETMEAELMVTFLQELKALRSRCKLFETHIVHLNQTIKEKNEKILELKEKIK